MSLPRPTKPGFYWYLAGARYWEKSVRERLWCVKVELNDAGVLSGWYPGKDYLYPLTGDQGAAHWEGEWLGEVEPPPLP